MATGVETTTERPARAPVVLYTLAFVLMLAALASLLLAVRSFLEDLWPLWVSVGLSSGAIAAAVAAFITGRRDGGLRAHPKLGRRLSAPTSDDPGGGLM